MKTAYLDHNIVIDIVHGKRSDEVVTLQRAGVTLVLSPAHWIEAARSRSLEEACKTAKTMDDLGAHWLRERRDLQRREVTAWAAGKPYDIRSIQPILRTASELASDYSQITGAIAIVTSEMMVRHMHRDESFREVIQRAYKGNTEGFERNAAHVRDGKLTAEMEQRIWRSWIASVAQEIGKANLEESLDKASRSNFPSILTEYEIAKENWTRAVDHPEMKLSANRLNDCFHAIAALPYVDYIISRDNGLRGLINGVRSRLPFRTAQPVEALEKLSDELERA